MSRRKIKVESPAGPLPPHSQRTRITSVHCPWPLLASCGIASLLKNRLVRAPFSSWLSFMLLPVVVILALEKILDGQTIGALIGGLTGYLLSGISNYDRPGGATDA